MTSNEVAKYEGSAWAMVKDANNATERFTAGQYAVEPIPVPEFDRPVPRFFFDLPWGDDDDATVAGILAQLASADDIDTATHPTELRKASELVGEPVTVLGMVARKSGVEDAAWGAYLACTVSVDGGEPEMLPIGSPQICVTLWRRWCEGRFPVSGQIVALGSKKPGRNQPLGFEIEEAF